MGTKSCATWGRQNRSYPSVQESQLKLKMQDEWHGQPHGMFSADECFGGRELNRGIELCAVVEQMYSLQHMFRVHGDPSYLDRCERIAYNALPGTITPDMWQHQYLQQANEINALYGESKHPWQTDGPDSTGFGVAPNFGCCTANMQQGWPKLTNNVLLRAPDGGFALGLIAPVVAKHGGISISVTTEYPFGDTVEVVVRGTTVFHPRVPGWATAATLLINGAPGPTAANGTLPKVTCTGLTNITLLLNPEIRTEFGWGAPTKPAPPSIPYAPGGALVPSDFAEANYDFMGGASFGQSRLPNGKDLRSGDPGDNATFVLAHLLSGEGHPIEAVSLAFRYVTGYGPTGNPDAPILRVVLLDGTTRAHVQTLFTSKPLNGYSFDHFTKYSPPVPVSATGLHIANSKSLLLGIAVQNNKQNLQINIDGGLDVRVQWAKARSPGPAPPLPGPIPGTNAAAVMRGPLLYSLHLEQQVKVVKTWSPFNNTDVDLTTATAWNYALNTSAGFEYVRLHDASPALPFDTTKYPSVIQATGVRLNNWVAGANPLAADEPPASPVQCTAATCGADAKLLLVPYAATNIRMAGLPWL